MSTFNEERAIVHIGNQIRGLLWSGEAQVWSHVRQALRVDSPVSGGPHRVGREPHTARRRRCLIDNSYPNVVISGERCASQKVMYGRILRHLRESKGRSQAEVARAVAISPAHLARLEAEQRGLYVQDFVRIAEELGEKPGNLLPNDLGAIGHIKPLVDRLAAVPSGLLPQVTAILSKVVVLAESVVIAAPPARTSPSGSRRPASPKKGRR